MRCHVLFHRAMGLLPYVYAPVIRLKMAISGRHAYIHADETHFVSFWSATHRKQHMKNKSKFYRLTELLVILICIYKSKLFVICFSPNIIQCTKSTSQKPSCSEKIHFHEVVLNVLFKNNGCWAFSCYHVWHHANFVWLPWQPFKSRNFIGWGLFVITTWRDIELLVYNHMHKIAGCACAENVGNVVAGNACRVSDPFHIFCMNSGCSY